MPEPAGRSNRTSIGHLSDKPTSNEGEKSEQLSDNLGGTSDNLGSTDQVTDHVENPVEKSTEPVEKSEETPRRRRRRA